MINDPLEIALVQMEIAWENPKQNRMQIESMIKDLSTSNDIIVLPEMFTTGFSMHPERNAENMKGETISWMKEMAQTKQMAITGSLIIQEEQNYFNRLVFVFPSGDLVYYDKRHLFTLAGEEKVYVPGKEKLIVDFKGWKICPLICYDLRFPVWSRNTSNFDVLIYVANWPKPRIKAWNTLLKARSIENMCYTIGVNRVGTDPNGMNYPGNSVVINALGEIKSDSSNNHAGLITAKLDKQEVENLRNKLSFLADQDTFEIIQQNSSI